MFNFVESGKMLETRDVDSVSDLGRACAGHSHDLESVSDLEGDGTRDRDCVDGSESRGPAWAGRRGAGGKHRGPPPLLPPTPCPKAECLPL